jgi:hypothetical protein
VTRTIGDRVCPFTVCASFVGGQKDHSLKLLSAFNAGRVKYLIVGGYAVSFHAQPRATKDPDGTPGGQR